MKADIKTRWVEALRSGHYKQGKGQLRPTSDSYCCLGVLCDIMNPEGWTLDDGLYIFEDRFFGVLSPELRSKTGVNQKIHSTVMDMNDIEKKPFKEIAQWIQENA